MTDEEIDLFFSEFYRRNGTVHTLLLRSIGREIEKVVLGKKGACKWVRDRMYPEVKGYSTLCGQEFVFANSGEHCVYCGGKIEVV